jgi:hypothetical protein
VALVPYQSLAGEVGSGGDGEETLVAALVNLLRPALLSLFVQVLTHSAQCTYPRLPLTCYSLFNHFVFLVQGRAAVFNAGAEERRRRRDA